MTLDSVIKKFENKEKLTEKELNILIKHQIQKMENLIEYFTITDKTTFGYPFD